MTCMCPTSSEAHARCLLIILIAINVQIYELLVLDTKPDNAVCIIECDMKVDFAAPVGYVQPEPERMQTDVADGQDDDVMICCIYATNRKQITLL